MNLQNMLEIAIQIIPNAFSVRVISKFVNICLLIDRMYIIYSRIILMEAFNPLQKACSN